MHHSGLANIDDAHPAFHPPIAHRHHPLSISLSLSLSLTSLMIAAPVTISIVAKCIASEWLARSSTCICTGVACIEVRKEWMS